MDIKIIILISVAFLNFALGLAILLQNAKSVVNRWFAGFSFSLSLWSFFMMMYESTSENWASVFTWSLILHFAGALIAYSFFYFCLVYPNEKAPLNKFIRILYALPLLFIAYFLFIDQRIVIGLQFNYGIRKLFYGQLYFSYFAYFFLAMGGGLLVLIVKLFKYHGIEKKRIAIFFWSVLLPIIYSGTINMVLAALGDFRFAWTGPIALFIVVASIAYGIIKYNFLDVKVIATEIFAVFLILVALIEVFMTGSLTDLFVRIAILIITVIVAILLIRSMLREVRRREEMEVLNKKLNKVTKDLEKANKELKRLDESKSEFLSISSHQLRTPLTIIKGYSSMLLEGSFGKMTKPVKESVEKIFVSTERLINLVESLLNISRIEAGRIEFKIEPVDLMEVAKLMVNDFQDKAKARKLKLVFNAEEKVPKVGADAQKIKDVVSNIIDNAIKYTKQGEIMVSLHQEGTSVVFSSQDTGIGLEAEDINRLFNKFTRGKDSAKVNTEGTGLGLYYARVLVENMGGRIWVESPGKGQGSKFSFSLPLADKARAKKVAG